jgi:hypothetical protein
MRRTVSAVVLDRERRAVLLHGWEPGPSDA